MDLDEFIAARGDRSIDRVRRAHILCPTNQPTNRPTNQPTNLKQPTNKPTNQPETTNEPTNQPTNRTSPQQSPNCQRNILKQSIRDRSTHSLHSDTGAKAVNGGFLFKLIVLLALVITLLESLIMFHCAFVFAH